MDTEMEFEMDDVAKSIAAEAENVISNVKTSIEGLTRLSTNLHALYKGPIDPNRMFLLAQT